MRFRRRITLTRLAAVPLIVGITFAGGSSWHAPWQASAINAGLFVLPVFITGPTLAEWIIFYFVAGILVGFVTPPFDTHSGARDVSRPSASQRVVPTAKGNPPAQ